jgi:hypothetical protein
MLELLLTIAGVLLCVAVLIITVYDLPGLFSLLRLRRLAVWSERQVSKLPPLPRILDRRYY